MEWGTRLAGLLGERMPEGGCVHEHTSVAVREQCWEATAEQEKGESAVGF